ncbi:hypothetical protein E4U42_000043 [Claviceps africana]|uniref:Uncharacterized protein n=1 Tax=Claviceps africana TaxID=83212 RepID=A0A8K0NLZ8_9HYPO|nr:hypothetical protein E4U42_000043 [Claviceps africana]
MLVGTGSAIAAAASGLVFGQPAIQSHKTDYHEIPTSARARVRAHKRAQSTDQVLPTHSASHSRISILPSRRPATSSATTGSVARELHAVAALSRQTSRPPLSRRQRPPNPPLSPHTTSSRHAAVAGDPLILSPGLAIKEESKEPTSRPNSWFRRLSIRPLSQQGSFESSIVGDSTSFTISHGSSAPILSRTVSASKPLAPNKLVKRSLSRHKQAEDGPPNRRSKASLPSLRRPATSHQRSATLQQFRADIDVAGLAPHPKYSFDEPIPPEQLLGASPIEEDHQDHRARRATSKLGWTSFFHNKRRIFDRTTSSRSRVGIQGDAGAGAAAAAPAFRSKSVISTRIHMHPGSSVPRGAEAYLVKPNMVTTPSKVSGSFVSCAPDEGTRGSKGRRTKDGMDSPSRFEVAAEVAPAPRTRRSFSCSFAHTAAWTSKATAPGSSRRAKTVATAHECGIDHGSDHGSDHGTDHQRPVSALNVPFAVDPFQNGPTNVNNMHMQSSSQAPRLVHHSDRTALAPNPTAAAPPRPHARAAPRSDASPPPAPLAHLPGCHAVSSASARPTSPATTGGASCSMRSGRPPASTSTFAGAAVSQRRGSHSERFYTLDGLDGDARDPNSGDDDDTDVKSDAFDSVRTTGSGRARAVETPVESVYDDTPPSTGGNNKKSKRSSVQDLMDRPWNEDSRIMEEDEMGATPDRTAHTKQPGREHKDDARLAGGVSHPLRSARQVPYDMDRLSLDDDGFDEDWTRDDDDALFSAPPSTSKGNSHKSARAADIDSNVQLALASIEGNSAATCSQPGLARPSPERTVSNLFDWSEPPPPAHDKLNPAGGAPRPQTSYSKQLGDSRGGRSVVRKGPVPMHVRSQSVPIVHEGIEDAKLAGPKYSTWGLGTKTVSEDWDEDFEFAGDSDGGPGGQDNRDLFAVPESIRASQPSVKAHSGQIREFSLLVNDLKRLCRHGRELNMLNGDERSIWKEAEGIIALASPDEDHVGDNNDDDDEDNDNDNDDDDDDNDNDDDESGSSVYVDAFELSGAPPARERGFDLPIEVLGRDEPAMSKTAVVRDRPSPRRRSVFSIDDDIFGPNWPLTEDHCRSNRTSRPRTPENQSSKPHDVSVIVRSVVETMQKRALMPTTEPGVSRGAQNRSYNATNRMHFDTNSLKALVRRAGELRDVLADMIRKADQLTQSPVPTPRHEKHLNSSPAFTRVFDDPGPSPGRRIARTRDNGAALVEYPSPDQSSPSSMGRRVPLMTVN